jgi:single-stranded DNA-binding protein
MDEIRVTVDQATVESFRRVETRTGRPMVSFRVGVGKEKLSCVAFNATAETAELREGDQVFVAGRLQSNSWVSPEGDKRWGVQVVADRIELIDAAQPGAQLAGETQPPAPAPPSPRPAPSARQRPAQRRLANQGEASEFDFVEGPF